MRECCVLVCVSVWACVRVSACVCVRVSVTLKSPRTRPIRSRSNLMHNFVALAEENEWLRTLDVDAVNADLAARRDHFEGLLASGEFWDLSTEEKEKVS